VTDPLPRFLALATRLLENQPAGHDQACGELMARIANAAPRPGDDPLARAVERLERQAPAPRGRLAVLFAVTALLCLASLAWLIPRHVDEFRLLEPMHGQKTESWDRGYERIAAAVKPADLRLELESIDDPSAALNEELLAQAKSRHEEHPDDPAFFHDFVRKYRILHRELPPDFGVTWRRIDADNAAWLALEMRFTHPRFDWDPLPQPKESEGSKTSQPFMTLHEIAGMKRWISPATELRRRQLARTPAISTVAEAFSASYASRRLCRRDSDYPGDFCRFVEWRSLDFEVPVLIKARDAPALRQLVRDWMRLLDLQLHDPALERCDDPSLSALAERAATLGLDCRILGLEEEADRLACCAGAAREVRLHGRPGDPQLARQASCRMTGGWYGQLSIPSLAPVTAADLTPGRLADHAVADRFAAVAAAILAMAALLLSAVEAWRRGPVPNALASGLGPMFRAWDHAWVWGLGLVLPVLWCGLTRLTPLGGRDIAINWFADRFGTPLFQPWLTQTMGTVVLALVLLVQSTRWRWAKRGACLCLRPAHLWLGWALAALLAAVVPAIGAIRCLTARHDLFVFAVSACGGLALLWLVWQAAAILFAPREASLDGVLLCRSLIPAFALLGLLALGSIPLFQQAERSWVARDQLSLPDPTGCAANGYDARIAGAVRQRLLKALEP